jgi:hypothetical protein
MFSLMELFLPLPFSTFGNDARGTSGDDGRMVGSFAGEPGAFRFMEAAFDP